MPELTQLIPTLKDIVIAAGEAILEVYHAPGEMSVSIKSDDSPVTRADQAAHRIIENGLRKLTPDIPVLSEEGGLPDFNTRQKWPRYWLVDPLDGTKEFINKNGEFTVNIALIEGRTAIMGIVYVPVSGVIYYAIHQPEADLSFAIKEVSGELHNLRVASLTPSATLNVVGSRRHGAEALNSMLDNVKDSFADIKLVSMGSSLKICAIAEGLADWYPRLALTSEWDTAAAHAVLCGAGGAILTEELQPLRYNQKDSLLNPFFHAVGDPSFNWSDLITHATHKV